MLFETAIYRLWRSLRSMRLKHGLRGKGQYLRVNKGMVC